MKISATPENKYRYHCYSPKCPRLYLINEFYGIATIGVISAAIVRLGLH